MPSREIHRLVYRCFFSFSLPFKNPNKLNEALAELHF